MNTCLQLLMCLLLFQAASPPRAPRVLHWDWHKSRYLSYSSSRVKDANMPHSDRAALAKAIQAHMGPPDLYDTDMASADQARQAALNAEIKMIRLKPDEKDPRDVVATVRGFCTADGNCPLWFFRKTSHGYRLLIFSIGQSFNIQKTTTNGFKDLVVNMHSSATDEWLKFYRYARDHYRRVACYDADWAPLKNGVVLHLKEPRITSSPCN